MVGESVKMSLRRKISIAMDHFNYDVDYDEVEDALRQRFGAEVDSLTILQIIEFLRCNNFSITGSL